MSTPSDPGENASRYVDELDEAVFGMENPDVPAPRNAVSDATGYAPDARPSAPRATTGSATGARTRRLRTPPDQTYRCPRKPAQRRIRRGGRPLRARTPRRKTTRTLNRELGR